jgi:hypothetical protein
VSIYRGAIDREQLSGVLANADAESKTVYVEVIVEPGTAPGASIVTTDKGTYGSSVQVTLEEFT